MFSSNKYCFKMFFRRFQGLEKSHKVLAMKNMSLKYPISCMGDVAICHIWRGSGDVNENWNQDCGNTVYVMVVMLLLLLLLSMMMMAKVW